MQVEVRRKPYTFFLLYLQVGLLLAVPPLIVLLKQSKQLQNYNVSSVELIYCGGAPLASTVIDEVKKR